MRSVPRHRSIVAIDIERSTSPERTNPIREELRHEAYRLLDAAMRTAGITDGHCDPLADRGDGVLALIHPADEVPKTLLLNPLVPSLATLLAERNASLGTAERRRRELRLRAVIHAGEIHYDGKGYFGEELDVAFRLLDAPRLKDRLRRVVTPLVLVVSEEIYWSIVQHEYDGIPGSAFEPLVRVTVAGRRRRGWVHVPVPRLAPGHAVVPVATARADTAIAA
jgi:class 3 adenylate cyclase